MFPFYFLVQRRDAGRVIAEVLGIYIGMSPADAYNAVKAADLGHRVTVGQVRIPELLGDKTAVYMMSFDTVDANDMMYVDITLPPNAQQVWEVHHTLGNLHVTHEQAVASLLNKYGAKYRSRAPDTFLWIFDEQGNLLDLPNSDAGTCQSQTMAAMNPLGTQLNGVANATVVSSRSPDIQFREVPHLWDPATFPQCQHLVWVAASIGGSGLNWAISVTISDYGLEHRSSTALINFFNGLANKEQKKEINKAEHNEVPKI